MNKLDVNVFSGYQKGQSHARTHHAIGGLPILPTLALIQQWQKNEISGVFVPYYGTPANAPKTRGGGLMHKNNMYDIGQYGAENVPLCTIRTKNIHPLAEKILSKLEIEYKDGQSLGYIHHQLSQKFHQALKGYSVAIPTASFNELITKHEDQLFKIFEKITGTKGLDTNGLFTRNEDMSGKRTKLKEQPICSETYEAYVNGMKAQQQLIEGKMNVSDYNKNTPLPSYVFLQFILGCLLQFESNNNHLVDHGGPDQVSEMVLNTRNRTRLELLFQTAGLNGILDINPSTNDKSLLLTQMGIQPERFSIDLYEKLKKTHPKGLHDLFNGMQHVGPYPTIIDFLLEPDKYLDLMQKYKDLQPIIKNLKEYHTKIYPTSTAPNGEISIPTEEYSYLGWKKSGKSPNGIGMKSTSKLLSRIIRESRDPKSKLIVELRKKVRNNLRSLGHNPKSDEEWADMQQKLLNMHKEIEKNINVSGLTFDDKEYKHFVETSNVNYMIGKPKVNLSGTQCDNKFLALMRQLINITEQKKKYRIMGESEREQKEAACRSKIKNIIKQRGCNFDFDDNTKMKQFLLNEVSNHIS